MTSRRLEFTPDHVDRLVRFCVDHPAMELPPTLLRRIMLNLCTSNHGVVALEWRGELALVAICADRLENPDSHAAADVCGLRADLEPAIQSQLINEALECVERFVRPTGRPGIDITLTQSLAAHSAVLTKRHYAFAFTGYDMLTPAMPPPPPVAPPPGLAWSPAHPALIRSYYDTLYAAMEPVPGAYVASFDTFEARVANAEIPHELLVFEGGVAGFSIVSLAGSGEGSVTTLGRHPNFRGRGLGPVLLTRAMNTLANRGARFFRLDVSADNPAALALYEKFGFEIVEELPTWCLPLTTLQLARTLFRGS